MGGAGSLGSSASYSKSLTVSTGASFTYSSSANQTLLDLRGAGTINLNGAGTVTISGDHQFTGTLNVSQTVNVKGGSGGTYASTTTGLGRTTLIDIKNGGTLVAAGDTTTTSQNTLIGDGAPTTTIQINQGGVLTTSGYTASNVPASSQTFNLSSIILSGGTISTGTGAIASNWGIFNFGGTVTVTADSTISAAFSTLTLSTGTVFDVAAGVTLNVTGTLHHSTSGTDVGFILNKNTTCTGGCIGTMVLAGANTYTGYSKINGGTLSVGSGGSSGTNLSTSTVTISGGTLLGNTTGNTISNAITLSTGANVIAAQSGKTVTFGGIISGAGTGALTVGDATNNGTVVFSNTNT